MSGKHRPTVYIVHHVDTEGPLCEPLPELFKRVDEMCGVKLGLAATPGNLEKLRRGSVKSVPDHAAALVKQLLDPHALDFKKTWAEIDVMLRKLLRKDFRDRVKDPFGGGWIFNWHVMDHAGYLTNERRRDTGFLKVFSHYERLIKETGSSQDELHWHFHPVSFLKEAHIPATSYENSYYELNQIICRRLIEKNWFPRVNRAGFHVIRPDSNWFLEQWIPFDASNQAIKGEVCGTPAGRFSDWRGAKDDWSIYNPDLYDWRKPGTLKRHIARALNLRARFANISLAEVNKAFDKAEREKTSVYLGITNHDFRDMGTEIGDFLKLLEKAAAKHPNVKFRFSGAVQAFREVLGFSPDEVKAGKLDLDLAITGNVLSVNILNGEPFGPQPYLAIKTADGRYFHDNLDFQETKQGYTYSFDRYTFPLDMLDTVAVASNDKFGSTCVARLIFQRGKVRSMDRSFQV